MSLSGPGRVKTFFLPQKLHATVRDPRRRDRVSIFLLYRVFGVGLGIEHVDSAPLEGGARSGAGQDRFGGWTSRDKRPLSRALPQ